MAGSQQRRWPLRTARAATAWFCKGRAVTWWWRAAPTPCPVVYSVLGGVRGGGTRVDGPKPERHRMAYEFAEFARIIAEKDADAEAAARMRTMRVMELLDVLHEK